MHSGGDTTHAKAALGFCHLLMNSSTSPLTSRVKSLPLIATDLGAKSGGLSATSCRIWVVGEEPQKRKFLLALLEECEHISPIDQRFVLHIVEDLALVGSAGMKDVLLLWNVSAADGAEILEGRRQKALPPVVIVLSDEEGRASAANIAKRHLLREGAADCLSWDEVSAATLERSIRLALLELSERIQKSAREQEAERQDANIVANMPGVVFRMVRRANGGYYFDFVSELARAVWGEDFSWNDSDLRQHSVRIHTSDQPELVLSLKRSAQEMSVWEWRGRLLGMHGEWRWVRSSALPWKRDDGAIVWDGLVTDESSVRNWQTNLERSRHALEEAQILSGVGSFDWDVVSGRIEWSDTMFRIYGYEPHAIKPSISTIFEHIHPDDQERIKSATERAHVTSGEPMFFRIRRADGQERIVQSNAYIELDEKGSPTRFIGSAQDVTDQLVAQQSLRESEERYALAARGAND
ncbi:MAG: PAS domain S-box protein, partial [Proteobacteria bacterium]